MQENKTTNMEQDNNDSSRNMIKFHTPDHDEQLTTTGERMKVSVYERILDDVIERRAICVFSDILEMDIFYRVMMFMRNKSGLNESILNDRSLAEGSRLPDASVSLPDDGEWVKGPAWLARRNAVMERLRKILFVKIVFGNDLEMRMVYNRDIDSTHSVHRSKNFEEKINFLLHQLMRTKKVIITGAEEEIVRFITKSQKRPYLLKKDSSGFFSTYMSN